MRDFWRGRRVLVTGHTDLKGASLCLWLEQRGAEVSALALAPDTRPALYDILGPWTGQAQGETDIRDLPALAARVAAARPQVVLHLAAHALVRSSHTQPAETFARNAMGIVNLLAALRHAPDLEAVVIATSDKVYANAGAGRPFVEDDRFGGKEPYSVSKACAELAADSFHVRFFTAGNATGCGDGAAERLEPDFVPALAAGVPLRRSRPAAVRPWQHVLAPLAGGLDLTEALASQPAAAPQAVNFGPDPDSFASLAAVAEALGRAFDGAIPHLPAPGPHPPEASTLRLPSDRAAQALSWSANRYRSHRDGADMRAFTLAQIAAYEERLGQ
ncbi:NAD-dependent epimerase/dehydratase family protein [Xanthobacter sp. V4C-4]|uniref:NAD-dependent epimerase/dehydratase family protein n=1 Tax=Xanthobacter cornucopiae TaxID=3119924 RepID=UPI00372B4908